jgi:ankyrin repeat protein
MKVRLLLQNGASCYASEVNPLYLAIKAKNYKCMRVLYREGDASRNLTSSEENSPLEMAVKANDHKLVKELLNWKELQGSLGEKLGKEGKNIMHHIAENNGCDVFRAIISETKNKHLNEIRAALNESLDQRFPWMTPLALC